jgi:hypothetical protein
MIHFPIDSQEVKHARRLPGPGFDVFLITPTPDTELVREVFDELV